MKRAVLAVLMATLTAAVGCEGSVYTQYDAKSDTVGCERVNLGGTVDAWTEAGYVCHANAKDRVKPAQQKGAGK